VSFKRVGMIVSLGLSLALAVPVMAATWTQTSIDTFGLGPSVAVSSDGQVHVAYWLPNRMGGAFSNGLMLATGDSSGFTTAMLTTADLAYPSIAYDSANRLHVAAYIRGGSLGVAYITDATGVLTSETVTTVAQGTAPSLALAPDGGARIAYATSVDPGIYVATRGAAGWTSTRIADAVTSRLRLTTDAAGATHVVWAIYDTGTGSAGISYATDAGGSWAVKQLTTSSVDVDPDVAIGADGLAHVVFSRQGPRPQLSEVVVTPHHARVVRLLRATTESPDVAFDSTGAQHIAYFNGDAFAIHYRTDASGNWVDSEVAFSDPQLMLALAPAGSPWITYHVPALCCPASGGIVIAHD
jgi:hypothetical protein